MKSCTLILGVLLCIAASNARNFERRDVSSDAETADIYRRPREHINQRHKRRSWHNNYGYDYPQPPNPFYQDRRDYEQQSHQDLLPQIWRLLEELSAYVRRPPPPPQPIYIPYAVPYPIPQTCKCVTGHKPDKNVSVDNRFKDMEDEQNWGLVDSNEADEEEGDGSRPISFAPLVPKRPSKRPAVQLDHGSKQAGVPASSKQTTQAPFVGESRAPNICDIASLSCCTGNPQQQLQCFTNVGCSMSYEDGKACQQERILSIIDAYSRAYSPVQ